MTDRLRLPPIDAPVEGSPLVRARAGRRIRLVGAALMLLLCGTGARGVQLCLSPSDRTLRAAGVQRWDQVTVQARRGEILDRRGRRLATSVATPNVIVDPLLVEPDDVASLAEEVARILDLDPQDVAEKMRRRSRYARLGTRVHPATAAEIDALDHRALWTERNTRRYYPEESLAAPLLGFVDAAGVGQEGLEAALDPHLRGGNLLLQRRRDRRGLSVDSPAAQRQEITVGMDVHTTLDRSVQRITERALEGVMLRSEPASASAIVVEVSTGDILALANTPTFNPNAVTDDPAGRRNHVVQDAIEPGSVFKPFTVAAALETGVVSEHDRIDCEGGAWFVRRTRIRDDHPHGVVTLGEVIKYSSNIGTAKLALKVGPERFLQTVADFGFGKRAGISLPGERAGRVRGAASIKPIELATTSYGQGVTTTLLQLAMATAAIANDGALMRPRLVTRVEDMHGVPEYIQRPEVVRQVVSPTTARAVRRMMVTVTEPGGTATRARVPGYRVAGKTGTAEKVVDGQYSATARIGSFIGFVPADDPVLAIVVSVDEPSKGSRYGGIVAAPAFAEIAGAALRHLGIPPDPTLVEEGEEAVEEPPGGEPQASEILRMAWSGATWTMPDVTGRPLRDVLVGLQGTGVRVEFEGDGVAVAQTPTAGSPLPVGAVVSLVLR